MAQRQSKQHFRIRDARPRPPAYIGIEVTQVTSDAAAERITKCPQKTPARRALPGFLRSLAYIRRAIIRFGW
jgi:hypothetical protein